MFGHTLAAAGAIDAALACQMIRTNTVLPTINLDNPDPGLGITQFSNTVEHKPLNAVMCCSRGMSGLNTALVIQRHNA
jgi:3-oxoacyl-[acyl-carrier-protein] synthase II